MRLVVATPVVVVVVMMCVVEVRTSFPLHFYDLFETGHGTHHRGRYHPFYRSPYSLRELERQRGRMPQSGRPRQRTEPTVVRPANKDDEGGPTAPIRAADHPRCRGHSTARNGRPIDNVMAGGRGNQEREIGPETTPPVTVTDSGQHMRTSTSSPPSDSLAEIEIMDELETNSATPSGVAQEPPNGILQCRDHECPSYGEVEQINDAVVIREVAGGVYATKKSSTCNMIHIMDELYMPLRRYFDGHNVENISMPATTPVLQLAVRPDLSPGMCNFTYQTAFYLPKMFHTTKPTPLEESITISEEDATQYFVMRFHEDPTPRKAFEKYNELKALMDDTEHCYRRGEFRLAYYDTPSGPLPHLYEMWVPVDEQCNDVGDMEDFDNGSTSLIDDDWNLIFP